VTGIDAIASFCALNLRTKLWFCCFTVVDFTMKTNWSQFCFNNIKTVHLRMVTHLITDRAQRRRRYNLAKLPINECKKITKPSQTSVSITVHKIYY